MAVRQRRSLWSDIYQSSKVNKLSLPATLLYTWAIANFDDYGFQEGDPRVIKGTIFPRRDDISIQDIEKIMDEILSIENSQPLWLIHVVEGEAFIQDPVWFERQSFHGIRRKPSKILRLLHQHQIDTGLTPELVSEGCQFGSLREGEVKLKRSEDKASKPGGATPEAVSLSKLLLQEIQKWHPKFKEPDSLTGWARSIDDMMRIDRRTEAEIEEMIKWSQHDTFWRKNILSGTTLRTKFNTLYGHMISSKKPKKDILAGQRELDRRFREGLAKGKKGGLIE